MKRLSPVLIACLLFVISSVVYARDIPITGRWTCLNNVYGNWYDANGNLALKIGKDNTINGHKVVKAFEAGRETTVFFISAHIPVFQAEGLRPIPLEHYGKDYHEMLIVNGGQMILRKTKKQQYFESIGGVYLGMSTDDLTALYGSPSSVDNSKAMQGKIIWKYKNEGFDVQVIGGNTISSITIYSYGDRRFDRSGLSCNNSLEEFDAHYFNNYYSSHGYDLRKLKPGMFTPGIGHDERIFFRNYPESLTLTVAE